MEMEISNKNDIFQEITSEIDDDILFPDIEKKIEFEKAVIDGDVNKLNRLGIVPFSSNNPGSYPLELSIIYQKNDSTKWLLDYNYLPSNRTIEIAKLIKRIGLANYLHFLHQQIPYHEYKYCDASSLLDDFFIYCLMYNPLNVVQQ
jgi:hypothetical protein